jgi:hypothetical protein
VTVHPEVGRRDADFPFLTRFLGVDQLPDGRQSKLKGS